MSTRTLDEATDAPHPAQWLDEIRLAIQDAREAKPFGRLIGERITDANLFHLAPLVCLKSRGRNVERKGGGSSHRNGVGEL